MNLKTPPPEKLSNLIALAVADAGKLDRDRYTPMWEKWHWPNPVSGKCMVCLAGAIIAKSLNCSTKTRIVIAANRSANPKVTTITNPRWRRALLALDFARDGKWTSAFRTLQEAYPNPDMRKQLEALPGPTTPSSKAGNNSTHTSALSARAPASCAESTCNQTTNPCR